MKQSTSIPNPARKSGVYSYLLQQYSCAIGCIVTISLPFVELGLGWVSGGLNVGRPTSMLLVFLGSALFFFGLYHLPAYGTSNTLDVPPGQQLMQHPSIPDLHVGNHPAVMIQSEPVLATLFTRNQPILDPGVRIAWLPNQEEMTAEEEVKTTVKGSDQSGTTLFRYCRMNMLDVRTFCKELCRQTGADLIRVRYSSYQHIRNEDLDRPLTERVNPRDLPECPDPNAVGAHFEHPSEQERRLVWKPSGGTDPLTLTVGYAMLTVIMFLALYLRTEFNFGDHPYLIAAWLAVLPLFLLVSRLYRLIMGRTMELTSEGIQRHARKFGLIPTTEFIPVDEIEQLVVEKKPWKLYARLLLISDDRHQSLGYFLKVKEGRHVKNLFLRTFLDAVPEDVSGRQHAERPS